MSEIKIDPEGDLLLTVGPEDEAPMIEISTDTTNASKTFRVCSRTVSRQSKPLKALLAISANASPCKPSQAMTPSTPPNLIIGNLAVTPPPAKLTLPDDDPGKMEILLLILHGWNRSVPDTLALDDLLSLALLADKYDVVPVLRHWADKWVPALAEFKSGAFNARLLEVLWVLGAANTFEQVLTRLVVTSHLGGGGKPDGDEGGEGGDGAKGAWMLVDKNGEPMEDSTLESMPPLKGKLSSGRDAWREAR